MQKILTRNIVGKKKNESMGLPSNRTERIWEGLDLKQNKINSSREGELYYRVSSHFAVMYACVCEEIGIISFSIGRINNLSKYQKI